MKDPLMNRIRLSDRLRLAEQLAFRLNDSKESILLGTKCASNKRLLLRTKHLQTHTMIQGPSGSGKSFLVRQIVRSLLQTGEPMAIFVDDPKGDLFSYLEEDAAGLNLSERTVLFRPDAQGKVPVFNPFMRNGLSVADHALWILGAIKACWGQDTFNQTPQMARWLFNAIAPVIETNGTFGDAIRMLDHTETELRIRVLSRTSDEFIRREWEAYNSLPAARRREETASAFARLRPCILNPSVRASLNHPSESIDLGDVLRNGRLVLSYIPRYRPFDPELAVFLRTLLLQMLLAYGFNVPLGERPPLYLVLDEAEHVLERDAGLIETILNEGRSLGIHVILLFHTFAQVARQKPAVLSAILTNCRTKIIGGQLSQEDLKILTEEFFVTAWHSRIVRDEIIGLELEPFEETRVQRSKTQGTQRMYTRGLAHTLARAMTEGLSISEQESEIIGDSFSSSTGRSRLQSQADSRGVVEGRGAGLAQPQFLDASSGEVLAPTVPILRAVGSANSFRADSITRSGGSADGESWSEGHARNKARTVGRGKAVQRSSSTSEADTESESFGESESQQTGETDVPFTTYKKRYKVMSRQFLSLQDFLTEQLNLLKGQRLGNWALKPPEGEPVFFKAEWIRPLPHGRERLASFREAIMNRPYYVVIPSTVPGADGAETPPPEPNPPEPEDLDDAPPLDE